MRKLIGLFLAAACTLGMPGNGWALLGQCRTNGGVCDFHLAGNSCGPNSVCVYNPEPDCTCRNYNTAKVSNKFFVTLVKAHLPCTDGTTLHTPPFGFPACPVVQAGSGVSFGPKGSGQTKGVVVLNSSKQASDVTLLSKFVDLREGDDGTGAPFSGVLTMAPMMRVTDTFCTGNTSCTMIDVPFPVSLPCGTAASPPLSPGKCQTKTSANAVVPGVVQPGKMANVELGPLQVYNGSDLIFTQGLLLP